ncbi:MAG TPA: hypothetical protein PK857_07275 [Hyphomicrobium sp.]|nr:hypothetical protein [Hyphomicrobium sp.]HRO51281.1 hypothetical protein [Hyphomicrobium sp.]
MSYSAIPPRPSSPQPSSNVTYLPLKPRSAVHAETGSFRPLPFDCGWTEELERRRRAVARWRGSDIALKETMSRRRWD